MYEDKLTYDEWKKQSWVIEKPCYTSVAAQRLARENDGKIYTLIISNQTNLFILGLLHDKDLKPGDLVSAYHVVRK